MMQIRCQWCGWTYTMPRDALLYAVAKAQAEKAIHHVENCPKCRHALKIQVNELKRRIPPNTPLPEYTSPAPAASAPTPTPEPAKEIVEVKEVKEKNCLQRRKLKRRNRRRQRRRPRQQRRRQQRRRSETYFVFRKQNPLTCYSRSGFSLNSIENQ